MTYSNPFWRSLVAFAAGALLATGAFAQSIGWHQMPGAANDIGVGADGTAWVIGNDHPQGIPNDYHIYRLVNGNWQAVPGWAVRVAVGPRGDAWVINSTHNIFHWNGSAWDNNPGTGLDIGVGANGDVWLIGTDHAIWKWDPVASWQKKAGAADRIAVGPTGTPWVVNSSHQIFYSPNNGASWVNVPGGAIDIGVGSEGSVWIVGNDGSVWKYSGTNWVKADGGLTNITVDNKGNPWGVNASRQIWAASSGAQFAKAASPGPVGNYLATGGNLGVGQYMVSANKAFFAIQQGDGNLCVYKGSGPSDNRGYLWCHMRPGGSGDYFTVMQGDGNLCTYRGTGNADNRGYQWCSMQTASGGQFFVTEQDDGNLCVYRGTYQNYGAAVWCSGAIGPVPVVYHAPPSLSPSGDAAKYSPSPVKYDEQFPSNQPCPTAAYTVPAGINYVKITATGGSGLGSDATNVWATLVAVGGVATGQGDKSLGSPSWADVSGGTGGKGASVSGIFQVTPGQKLYVVAGEQAAQGQTSSRGVYSSGFPGGGWGYQNGGGYSMVATQSPSRPNGDGNYCYVPQNALLILAGGGGGAGSSGTGGSGGNGGDAGLIGEYAKAGQSGGGAWSGGGGGGGALTAGGSVGSHPGCGSELRSNGSYLRGSDNRGGGGAGGGGLYGGGGGGGGDCFMATGDGGGGGGSSYIHPAAMAQESHLDTTYLSGVVIQPMK